jgi:FkbM family methyltransferase
MIEPQEIYDTLNKAYFSEHPDEEEVLRHLPGLLDGCRHFVDIGASLGQFTLHASRMMRNGRIDAFEADPVRFHRLKENCATWAAESGNVIQARPDAVAKTSGTLTFHSTQSNVSGGLFPNDLAHLDEKTRAKVSWTRIDVPAVSLDDCYADAPPQVIKMDIEGAEGDALLGSTRILEKRATIWLIELHNFEQGWKAAEVIAFMKRHRYEPEMIAPARYVFRPSTRKYFLGLRLPVFMGKAAS